MTRTEWQERAFDPEIASQLNSSQNLPPLIARVLASRGIDSGEKAQRYLNPKLEHIPDPSLFKDIDKAVTRLAFAVKKGELIGVFGDYDVDGVTSTAILCDFLEQLGASVVPMIPDRLKEGYGLSISGVDRLHKMGAKLVVTVDCGVTAHQEVEEATARGLEVIVIDHHTVPTELPKAVAVMNPHRLDCERQAHHLCAAGVVFNLCIALRKYLRDQNYFATRQEPPLSQFLDLVALGTVADVVPLIDDNRIFVTHGLSLIAKSTRPGIRAMLDVAGIEPAKVSASTLGFHLGPRINAAGRLEDAMQAVNLLRSREYWHALDIAKRLDAQNQSRRDLEKQILEEAVAEINISREHQEALVLVVGRQTWHPGVVGIVASRLVDRFAKPAIVIGENGKGSGRSISAFHLHDALTSVRHTLIGFGGHAHAAGVHLDFANLSTFRDELNAHAKNHLKSDDLYRTIWHDGLAQVDEISDELADLLQKAQPFGRSNPEPAFRFNQVELTNLRGIKGGHLKGQIRAHKLLDFIAFGMADKLPLLYRPVDILANFEMNEWNGRRNLQFKIKDMA